MGVVVRGGKSRRRGGGLWRSVGFACASSSSKAPVIV